MKATSFAVLLSLFVASHHALAVDLNTQALPVPTEQKTIKINLNKADAQTLSGSFKGIGKKRAEAIVSYREAHGAFSSVEQLGDVRGVGKTFVKRHLDDLQSVFSIE